MENVLKPMKKTINCSKFAYKPLDFCEKYFFDLTCPVDKESGKEIVVLQALKLGNYFLIEYAYKDEYSTETSLLWSSNIKKQTEPEFTYFKNILKPESIKMETEITC